MVFLKLTINSSMYSEVTYVTILYTINSSDANNACYKPSNNKHTQEQRALKQLSANI